MQPVCQQCGRLVAVNQIFCGNCGTKLNAAELDGPTERLDESWPQQPSGRLLAGSPFSYPGGTNAAPLDFYTATLDGRDHSGTYTFPSDPYGTLWYDVSGPQTPPPVSAPPHPHMPVTTFPGSRAAPNSYNSHTSVLQQQRTQM